MKEKLKEKKKKSRKKPLTLESVEGGQHLIRVGHPPHGPATGTVPRLGLWDMERVGAHAKTPVWDPDAAPVTVADVDRKRQKMDKGKKEEEERKKQRKQKEET